MRVWIDADACPRLARDQVVKFALKRGFEVVLVAGQAVARLVYEPLTDRPTRLYGEDGSHYQRQGLKLSKHFKLWE